MNEEEVKDCYGTILHPNDVVITHTSYGADPPGFETGIVRCTISHLSRQGRVMLQQENGAGIIQRWPKQTVKYEKQTNISN